MKVIQAQPPSRKANLRFGKVSKTPLNIMSVIWIISGTGCSSVWTLRNGFRLSSPKPRLTAPVERDGHPLALGLLVDRPVAFVAEILAVDGDRRQQHRAEIGPLGGAAGDFLLRRLDVVVRDQPDAPEPAVLLGVMLLQPVVVGDARWRSGTPRSASVRRRARRWGRERCLRGRSCRGSRPRCRSRSTSICGLRAPSATIELRDQPSRLGKMVIPSRRRLPVHSPS